MLNLDPSTTSDLKDLAKYVSLILQRCQITILQSNDNHFSDSFALEQKYHEMDTIGIPYSIIVNSDSLQNGFMQLRNRDTTLSETIHINSLKDYLPQIFQS